MYIPAVWHVSFFLLAHAILEWKFFPLTPPAPELAAGQDIQEKPASPAELLYIQNDQDFDIAATSWNYIKVIIFLPYSNICNTAFGCQILLHVSMQKYILVYIIRLLCHDHPLWANTWREKIVYSSWAKYTHLNRVLKKFRNSSNSAVFWQLPCTYHYTWEFLFSILIYPNQTETSSNLHIYTMYSKNHAWDMNLESSSSSDLKSQKMTFWFKLQFSSFVSVSFTYGQNNGSCSNWFTLEKQDIQVPATNFNILQ